MKMTDQQIVDLLFETPVMAKPMFSGKILEKMRASVVTSGQVLRMGKGPHDSILLDYLKKLGHYTYYTGHWRCPKTLKQRERTFERISYQVVEICTHVTANPTRFHDFRNIAGACIEIQS